MTSTKSRLTAPARSQAAVEKINLESIQGLVRELSSANEQLESLRQAMQHTPPQNLEEGRLGPAQVGQSLKEEVSDSDRLFTQVFARLDELETACALLRSKLEPVRAEEPEADCQSVGSPPASFRGSRLTWSLNELQHRLAMLTERVQQTSSELVI